MSTMRKSNLKEKKKLEHYIIQEITINEQNYVRNLNILETVSSLSNNLKPTSNFEIF